MPYLAETNSTEIQMEEACQRSFDQARLLLPLDELTVVLLDSVSHSNKVVFSWKSEAASCGKSLEHIRLPINGNYDTLGSVSMSTFSPHGFSRQESRLAVDITKQLAIHLENIQLHQQVETASAEMELVYRIAGIINSAPSIDAVYSEFAEATRRLVNFDRISINTIDHDAGILTVKYLLGPTLPGRGVGDTASLEDTTTGYISQSGKTVIRNGLCFDARFSIDPILSSWGFKSVISIPVKLNGSVNSILGLHSKQARAFGAREQALLERLANLIAPTVENARLQTQMQATEQRRRVLSEVNHILDTTGDLDAMFGRLIGNLCTEIDIDQAQLSWIKSKGYEIDTLISTPKNSASVRHSTTTEFNEPLSYGLKIPLSCKNEMIGLFQLVRATCPFNAHDRELLQLIGNHIAPAVYNQGLLNLTMQQAYQLTHQSGQMTSTAEGDNKTIQPEQAKLDDLAHALYSPLTSIKGYTDTLLQRGHQRSEEVNQEFLQTINQAADRLGNAIRDLLLPTTNKHQEAVGRSRQTRVQEVFRQSELALATSPRPMQVSFGCDPNLPEINIDPYLFDRVLAHLIDCSISASAAPISLQVLAESGQGSAVVSLRFTSEQPFEGQVAPATSTFGDTDLRVIACHKLLKEQGINLDIDRPDESLVLFRFAVPFSQTDV